MFAYKSYEKWESSYYHPNAISVFGLMYRNTSYFLEKHHFATFLLWCHNKTFCFVYVHLTASNKGELSNQNAAYKIIALESGMLPSKSCDACIMLKFHLHKCLKCSS